MPRSLPTMVSAVLAGAVCAAFLPALAQADAPGAGEASTVVDSCAWVDDGAPRAGYFRDLCRALAVAVQGDEGALSMEPVEAPEVGEAFRSGRHPLAYGVPFELRADPGVRIGPVLLIGDPERWALAHAAGEEAAGDVAAWLFHALVQAEAFGANSAAVEAGLPDEARERILAYEARLAEQLGLAPNFLRRTIGQLGHHGEIWARHFDGEPGPNRPVELGGQLFAPPASDR